MEDNIRMNLTDVGNVWSGCMWPSIGPVGHVVYMIMKTLGFHEKWRIS
jgi:hypothetical protein